jgi:branched-chain amino acid transport system substrate-binding protein
MGMAKRAGDVLVLGACVYLGAVSADAQEKKPIVIGGSLPLTGQFAETGKWIERGMKFWVAEVNAAGGLLGRPVELKIYDDESNANKAVTFAEKAITVDKVNLLLAVIRHRTSRHAGGEAQSMHAPWAAT